MSNPEEYITYDGDSVVRHETVNDAEQFAGDISYVADEVFVQEVESDDMDDTFNTFRSAE